MAPGIDMNDRNAWDDSWLQDSWNGALAEYNKYHSIQAQGKRLEDVLSEEELKQLREEHGDLVQEANARPSIAGANNNADQMDTEHLHEQTNGPEHTSQENKTQAEEPAASEYQEGSKGTESPARPLGRGIDASMPQAILGTVQDESLKNLMMSWYYAGYYTGLHVGQQQASQGSAAKQ